MQVAHGRIPSAQLEKNNSELCFFVLDSHGRQITDVQEQKVLVQCMKEEIENPVRIMVGTRGTDTQLLVATPIEKGGRGRPRVLHDVTQALNVLGISIFEVIRPLIVLNSFMARFFSIIEISDSVLADFISPFLFSCCLPVLVS